MSTLAKRKLTYKFYKRVLDNSSNKMDMFTKDKLLGSGGQGKVYRYCIKGECKVEGLAIKQMYLDKKEAKYVNNEYDAKALRFGTFIERASDMLLNELLKQKVTQNFVFTYKDEFEERDGVCSDIYPYKGYFFKEFIPNAQMYMNWVQEEHTLNVWYNAYFQITSAVYVLQKYFNMTHLDLHSENIMVRKVKKGGYWGYKINGKIYKVPNLGYIFYIIDFGHAYVPDTFKSWFVKRYKKIHRGFDIYQLFKSTLKMSTSPQTFKTKIRRMIKGFSDNQDFEYMIEDIFGEMYITKSVRSKRIEMYDMDKHLDTEEVPKELRHICQH